MAVAHGMGRQLQSHQRCAGDYAAPEPNAADTIFLAIRGGHSAKMTVTTASFGSAGPAPSHASLGALDAVNFFVAGILAGFGPYVAAYLADQKWNQENIGFVLTASSLAGLLSQLPGGELLDTVRSKRAIIVAGVIVVAISAIIIAFEPRFPLVFIALMLQGITGGLLGLAIAAISLGLVGQA